MGCAPDCMKLGVLTPVFKRKGSNLDAKNYRGITITPTISKILESIIREMIQPIITENKKSVTEGSSPMNCSLILEEYIRNNKDSKLPTYIAFLDAKSAFDVVSHTSLLRKIYHIRLKVPIGIWSSVYIQMPEPSSSGIECYERYLILNRECD